MTVGCRNSVPNTPIMRGATCPLCSVAINPETQSITPREIKTLSTSETKEWFIGQAYRWFECGSVIFGSILITNTL